MATRRGRPCVLCRSGVWRSMSPARGARASTPLAAAAAPAARRPRSGGREFNLGERLRRRQQRGRGHAAARCHQRRVSIHARHAARQSLRVSELVGPSEFVFVHRRVARRLTHHMPYGVHSTRRLFKDLSTAGMPLDKDAEFEAARDALLVGNFSGFQSIRDQVLPPLALAFLVPCFAHRLLYFLERIRHVLCSLQFTCMLRASGHMHALKDAP
jgi:hypothetical protein